MYRKGQRRKGGNEGGRKGGKRGVGRDDSRTMGYRGPRLVGSTSGRVVL